MEIEIRAEVNNLDSVGKKIIEMGGELKCKKHQIDIYFGEICLFEKIGYSFLIRVRDEGNKKFFTYKGARTKRDGIWEEYEFQIKKTDDAIKMLSEMGMEKIITVNKERKEYSLNDFTICLDSIENLGNFIEIEYVNEKAVGKEKMKEIIKLLGVKDDNIIHKGYVTMLLEKNNSKYSKYINN